MNKSIVHGGRLCSRQLQFFFVISVLVRLTFSIQVFPPGYYHLDSQLRVVSPVHLILQAKSVSCFRVIRARE